MIVFKNGTFVFINEDCIYRLEGMKSNFTVNKKKVWT